MKLRFARGEKKIFFTIEKVSKYYEYVCLQSFFLLFLSLFTALIVKSSHILAGSTLAFSINVLDKTRKVSIPNLHLSENIGKVVIK